ncbi:tRNA (guanosine(37)-N1)-methyltransferase TrmD [Candidatus Poribacteria bacterium]|nr:tRNA (guanosine(37)-N1)-methyltransferase TrmD [Candidatus Poribacteria bacterium]
MKIDVIAIFPEILEMALHVGILKRAIDRGLLEVCLHNLRDFAEDNRRTIDDYPYGGESGMVLKPEPIFAAVRSLELKETTRVVFLTPQGKPFNQKMAERFSLGTHLILICGRYKGVDERVREKLITDEVSIGDYVLSGGEVPALVLIDAVGRVLPSALGDYESAQNDSFSRELLDHPHYTRPAEFEGMRVPDVLLSGHHQKIMDWRRNRSMEKTAEQRPDLLRKFKNNEVLD